MQGRGDHGARRPVLLVLDYPGRRDEDRIADMNLESMGFDVRSLLAEPFVRAPTAAAYAAELVDRFGPFPAETTAVLAYCMAAPIAQEVAAAISVDRPPVPLVLFDGEPATAAAVHEQYLVTANQVASQSGTGSPETVDPARLEELLSTSPEAAVAVLRSSLLDLVPAALANGGTGPEAAAIAEKVADFYLDWLVHLVAAHKASWTAFGGEVFHVMSRDHGYDGDWPGAAGTERARVDVPRPQLLTNPATREITGTWLARIVRERDRATAATRVPARRAGGEDMADRGGAGSHRVVVNAEGRGGIWPSAKAIPPGWTATGFVGTRDECLGEAARLPQEISSGRDGTDGTDAPATAGRSTVLEMLERTVRKYPDHPAVSDDDSTLTYTDLWNQARAFGERLRARGMGEGDRVAIHLRRGVPAIVSMVGVLMAGAAYAAVDSRYPDARRDLMIVNSRPALVVTEADKAAELRVLGLPVLEWTDAEAPEDPGPLPGVRPGHVATVLFTSGSTGTPKAILLSHGNLRYFAENPGLPPLSPADRTGHVSSLSFDALHFEIWCSFAHGAEVVVLPSMADLIADDLQRQLRRRRITALLAPTMALNHVVYEDRDAFAALRVLHTGGDVVQPAACRELLAGSFSGEFTNLYGPAEGTTACLAHPVREVADGAASVPVGRPLPGAEVYVLGPDLDECPAGVTGELHIGGAGVALGYLDQPGLTAERFLPDPFGAPGGRMYATGDLGYRTEDGLIEFVGRADDQVKIRGYRVEPREVEIVLARHPSVREVAVVAAGGSVDRRLVALVAPSGQVTPSELRRFAVEQLPDYQVPSSFVQVPELPTTEHGKRDRDELERLARDHIGRRDAMVEPVDRVERYLAGMWESLLGVEWISRRDDFFALGGNSLLAFRMQRRIERDLRVSVGTRQILTATDLAGLAEVIRVAGEAG
ncbi:amino acid adenylation domain-containing protein [Actinomadura monticuli]|uniref:Amino acid adenylation domain-containing protein n=1 Tax=Actinomadura monticuli TaxID=3097367 RepID=A0ABV4Q4W9_9ACTN